MVGLCQLVYGNDRTPNTNYECEPIKTWLKPTPWRVNTLEPDGRYTIALEDLFKAAPLVFADISIAIEYRPVLLPWRHKIEFRFVTRKLSDGKLYWFARPSKK
jgi:hypothetical protein